MKPKLIAAIAIIACPTLALAQVSAGAGGTDGGAAAQKQELPTPASERATQARARTAWP